MKCLKCREREAQSESNYCSKCEAKGETIMRNKDFLDERSYGERPIYKENAKRPARPPKKTGDR
jgi:hypothetical protein